jgi:dipeptide/tripeptide permease
MVSITGPEYSYTQAPNRMKSFVMVCFMLSIALGNLFTSAVNIVIEGRDLLQGGGSLSVFSPCSWPLRRWCFLCSRPISKAKADC